MRAAHRGPLRSPSRRLRALPPALLPMLRLRDQARSARNQPGARVLPLRAASPDPAARRGRGPGRDAGPDDGGGRRRAAAVLLPPGLARAVRAAVQALQDADPGGARGGAGGALALRALLLRRVRRPVRAGRHAHREGRVRVVRGLPDEAHGAARAQVPRVQDRGRGPVRARAGRRVARRVFPVRDVRRRVRRRADLPDAREGGSHCAVHEVSRCGAQDVM